MAISFIYKPRSFLFLDILRLIQINNGIINKYTDVYCINIYSFKKKLIKKQ